MRPSYFGISEKIDERDLRLRRTSWWNGTRGTSLLQLSSSLSTHLQQVAQYPCNLKRSNIVHVHWSNMRPNYFCITEKIQLKQKKFHIFRTRWEEFSWNGPIDILEVPRWVCNEVVASLSALIYQKASEKICGRFIFETTRKSKLHKKYFAQNDDQQEIFWDTSMFHVELPRWVCNISLLLYLLEWNKKPLQKLAAKLFSHQREIQRTSFSPEWNQVKRSNYVWDRMKSRNNPHRSRMKSSKRSNQRRDQKKAGTIPTGQEWNLVRDCNKIQKQV